jgi:hypothetical protein
MKFTCNKCNKQLSSKIGLERHFNKKIPCDRILKCPRCETIYNKKPDLERHLQRKFPCKLKTEMASSKEHELQLRLEIEKLKNIQKEKEIETKAALIREKIIYKEKEIETKAALIREKIIYKEKEIDAKVAIIREKSIQKEKECESNERIKSIIFNTINVSKDKQIMVNEAKKDNALVIAKAKRKTIVLKENLITERKGQSQKNINNINITNNVNLYLSIGQEVISKLHSDNRCFEEDLMQLGIDYISSLTIDEDYDEEEDYYIVLENRDKIDRLINLYNKSSNNRELNTNILTDAFNHPDRTNERCIFYIPEINEFVGISKLDKNKEQPIRKINFDTIILPSLRFTLESTYEFLENNLQKYLWKKRKDDRIKISKVNFDNEKFTTLLKTCTRISLESIKSRAVEVFDFRIDEKLVNDKRNAIDSQKRAEIDVF